MAWETLISPLGACCWLALIWTVIAKAKHGFGAGLLDGVDLLRVISVDWLVYSLIGLGVAALAARRPRVAPALLGPVVVAVMTLAGINGFFLLETGEQGSWYDLMDAVARRKELKMVLEEISTPEVLIGTGATLSAVFIGVFVARWWTQKKRPLDSAQRASLRARAWAVSAIAGLFVMVGSGPGSFQEASLRKNVVLLVAKTAWVGNLPGKWKAFDETPPITAGSLEAFARRPTRPNVVFVILESTRFDHTALAGEEALADTPELGRLAENGAVAMTMRSVLPHTTKSMFSMLCGRYPTLQKGRVEPAKVGDAVCLPDQLRQAGYATAFAQSAFGTFESRPHLVTNFGFEAFEAYEDLKGEKVSYLSSDDASLARFMRDFLKRRESSGDERPFFVTLLTSATHHSYRLPRGERARARREKKPQKSAADRYARLVEAEDNLLRQLRRELERRKLWSNTIVVVVGDHGEGFGDHGVKQHDNNYFEEGLRVPFVMHGPGIKPQAVTHNASLIDTLPTLAAALDLEVDPAAELPGHDVFAADYPAEEPKFFACYKPHKCSGFVQGDLKFVEVPRDDVSLVFDLSTDPDERAPTLPPAELDESVERLRELTTSHRYRKAKIRFDEAVYFDIWRCSKHGVCKHPGAFKLKYRYDPEDPERDLSEDDAAGR